MTVLRHDLRCAMRAAGRRSGFTIVALSTLAAGIVASTAIFSITNALLLRPLPAPEPEGLVPVYEVDQPPARSAA